MHTRSLIDPTGATRTWNHPDYLISRPTHLFLLERATQLHFSLSRPVASPIQ